MFATQLSREINVSADKAWSLLVDWGNTAWLPGPDKTEVITKGEQITRRLIMTGADPIEETLLSAEPENKTLYYAIAASQLFPLQNYRGKIVVAPVANACRIDWSCSFDLAGMTNDEAQAAADRNLHFLLDSLKTYLES